jgi:FkbM family methyltransferase
MVKKLLKRIWRMVPPGSIKNKIHCAYYRKDGFAFAYRRGVFVIRGPRGIRMLTNEAPFNLIKYCRIFLKHYSPKPGDILIDAGGYNGHISILLSQLVGPSGRVIAFEPDPGNRALFRENMKLNDCNNIVLVDKGLWVEDATLEFNSNSSKASSVYYKAGDARTIKIEATSLDIFVQQNSLERCQYIKMNIEGSEIMALRGATEILRKFRPTLCITTDHVVDGKQTTEPVELILKTHLYEVWTEVVGSGKVTYAR